MTIIDFPKHMKEKNETFKDQLDNLVSITSRNYMDDFIKGFLTVLRNETRIGLGLEEDETDDSLPFFEMIDYEYQEAANGCYFCSHTDPNTDKFTPGSAKLCMMCAKKVVNILTAVGADQSHLLTLKSILSKRRSTHETADRGVSE